LELIRRFGCGKERMRKRMMVGDRRGGGGEEKGKGGEVEGVL
jgi:hypothetical protein